MQIKNKVKKIVCDSCGCVTAAMLVSTKKDFYEDCLSLNAEGIMTDGIDRDQSIEGEIIKQSCDEGSCPNCDGCDVTVYFENGKVLNSNEDDVIDYWLTYDKVEEAEQALKDKL